ncbi:MAG: exonuclease SbcCD subunit D C-terminal domain-containing protein [Bacteroidota bacterium]
MRLLHTSDWHLGQKFMGQSREAEHSAALEWLLQTIEQEQIETLVVAGDIFDVNNPPIGAETLYYRFLARLIRTQCRHVVIIGGNHDAPGKLEAPKKILHALGIHVVGCASDDLTDEIITLSDPEGKPELIVAAVPFLRDKDFKISLSGESMEARIARIKAGIYQHYHDIALQTALLTEQFPGTPVLATGHLYAKGASAGEGQDNIYIGNLENIAASEFPASFDYVALGHIHRPQKIGKQQHIRYCGSLIPLSFSEIADQKIVLICDFAPGKGLQKVHEIPVPVFRKLKKVEGTLLEVEAKLLDLNEPDAAFPAWVEVVVEGDQTIAGVDRHLQDFVKNMNLELLSIKRLYKRQALDEVVETDNLDTLTTEEVFQKRCETQGLNAEETTKMLQTFGELREWMDNHPELF